MRHATWTAIEASPTARRLYRSYRRLPDWMRAILRLIAMPRWHFAAALVRYAAEGRVLSGPFAGLRLELTPLSARHHLGYLLGTQELELRGVIERIVARGYGTVINIGAADGYYAVGLALRLPEAAVIAFEALPKHHPGLRRTAELNGIADRLRLEGLCQTNDLEDALSAAAGPTLVVADIEGGEVPLLDPDQVGGLRRADILIETHEALAPGCTQLLLSRFAATHAVTLIEARPRKLSDFPADVLPGLARWMPGTAVELMHERRMGQQQWLFLTAKEEAQTWGRQ